MRNAYIIFAELSELVVMVVGTAALILAALNLH